MKFSVLAASVALFASSAMVQADQLLEEAGGWEVYRSEDLGNGCYMSSAYEDGSLIQIGFDIENDTGFMTVSNSAWTDIEDGATYPVSFSLDDQSYTADAHGMALEGAGGIFVEIESEDFLIDLAQREVLSLSNEQDEVARIDLTGTRDAIAAIANCMEGA